MGENQYVFHHNLTEQSVCLWKLRPHLCPGALRVPVLPTQRPIAEWIHPSFGKATGSRCKQGVPCPRGQGSRIPVARAQL